MLSVVGVAVSASPTPGVVMSEVSALRLTEWKSVPEDFVAMNESTCTSADQCRISAAKPIQTLLAQS
jgi:hypothetical protein